MFRRVDLEHGRGKFGVVKGTFGHEKGTFEYGKGAVGAWKGYVLHFEQGLGGHGAAKVEIVDFPLVL